MPFMSLCVVMTDWGNLRDQIFPRTGFAPSVGPEHRELALSADPLELRLHSKKSVIYYPGPATNSDTDEGGWESKHPSNSRSYLPGDTSFSPTSSGRLTSGETGCHPKPPAAECSGSQRRSSSPATAAASFVDAAVWRAAAGRVTRGVAPRAQSRARASPCGSPGSSLALPCRARRSQPGAPAS